MGTDENKIRYTVIYHANCMDGFGSAWAAHKFLPESAVEYIACKYGEVPVVDLAGKELFILDFSFSRDILTQYALAAKSVVVLDHHKTAAADLELWEAKPKNVYIEFDMGRSGAAISWDYFSANYDAENAGSDPQPRPVLINYIQDRDLWQFKLHWSKEVNARIAIEPFTFENYNFLHTQLEYSDTRVNITREGTVLMKQHQKICEEIIKDAQEFKIFARTPLNTYTGLACNCTPQFSSEVGNLLAQKSKTFGATYHTDNTGAIKWSLRSNGNYDVSAIAKQYGGGGHRNAAGFVTSFRTLLNVAEQFILT